METRHCSVSEHITPAAVLQLSCGQRPLDAGPQGPAGLQPMVKPTGVL